MWSVSSVTKGKPISRSGASGERSIFGDVVYSPDGKASVSDQIDALKIVSEGFLRYGPP